MRLVVLDEAEAKRRPSIQLLRELGLKPEDIGDVQWAPLPVCGPDGRALGEAVKPEDMSPTMRKHYEKKLVTLD